MPTEFNLPYVLDKAKNLPDMVQYHIINSQEFMASLHRVFTTFRQRQDKMGMGTVARILASILSNVDNNLALVLFKDPNFAILLEVQQCTPLSTQSSSTSTSRWCGSRNCRSSPWWD